MGDVNHDLTIDSALGGIRPRRLPLIEQTAELAEVDGSNRPHPAGVRGDVGGNLGEWGCAVSQRFQAFGQASALRAANAGTDYATKLQPPVRGVRPDDERAHRVPVDADTRQQATSDHEVAPLAVAAQRREAKSGEIPEDAHGTIDGYTNYLCPCDDCRAAEAECMRPPCANRKLKPDNKKPA